MQTTTRKFTIEVETLKVDQTPKDKGRSGKIANLLFKAIHTGLNHANLRDVEFTGIRIEEN